MTFLKKIGSLLVQGVAVISGLTPLLKVVLPNAAGTIDTVTNDLQAFKTIIVTVEGMGQAVGLTGPQKLAASLPSIEQAILSSAALVGHKINDEALFKKAVGEYAQATADLLNSLHDSVESESKT